MLTDPPPPRATFSGVSGSRNPGVTVTVALEVEPVVRAAVTLTCTLSAVRYGGGVYWPLLEIVPAPEIRVAAAHCPSNVCCATTAQRGCELLDWLARGVVAGIASGAVGVDGESAGRDGECAPAAGSRSAATCQENQDWNGRRGKCEPQQFGPMPLQTAFNSPALITPVWPLRLRRHCLNLTHFFRAFLAKSSCSMLVRRTHSLFGAPIPCPVSAGAY